MPLFEYNLIDTSCIKIGVDTIKKIKLYSGKTQLFYPDTLYKFEMYIKKQHGGKTFIELSTDNNGIVIDYIDKTLSLMFTKEITENIPVGIYIYDIKMIHPNNESNYLISGSIEFNK